MWEAVDILLHALPGSAEMENAAVALFACLAAPVAMLLASDDGVETRLPDGVALSPALAAECTKDPVRTAMLLRGVNAALGEALRRFPNETIEVVYAGTGPLAPLMIPLMPRFRYAPLAVTFLDIHPASVRAARTVAEHFGVDGTFVAADATRYRHPVPIHLLIIETMQQALTREPQVAIVRHLAPQLVQDGLMVPESVRVDLVVADAPAQRLLDLRTQTADLPVDEDDCLPAVTVRLSGRGALPVYETRIVAFGEHVIEPYQSGLTQPRIAWELLPLDAACELELRYQLGAEPRFRWQK